MVRGQQQGEDRPGPAGRERPPGREGDDAATQDPRGPDPGCPRRREQGPEKQTQGQIAAEPRGWLRRLGRARGRVQDLFRPHEGSGLAVAGDADPSDAVAQGQGQEQLLPRRDRPVGGRSEREVGPGVDERIDLREAPRVVPVAEARRLPLERAAQRAAEHAVEQVPDPRRAVVEEVLVGEVAVARQGVPVRRVAQHRLLGRGEVQLLEDHLAVGLAVEVEHDVGPLARHHVEHAALQEARHEVGLPEVEDAPVVGEVASGAGVQHPQGVVAVVLPHRVAGTGRHQPDAQLVAGFAWRGHRGRRSRGLSVLGARGGPPRRADRGKACRHRLPGAGWGRAGRGRHDRVQHQRREDQPAGGPGSRPARSSTRPAGRHHGAGCR